MYLQHKNLLIKICFLRKWVCLGLKRKFSYFREKISRKIFFNFREKMLTKSCKNNENFRLNEKFRQKISRKWSFLVKKTKKLIKLLHNFMAKTFAKTKIFSKQNFANFRLLFAFPEKENMGFCVNPMCVLRVLHIFSYISIIKSAERIRWDTVLKLENWYSRTQLSNFCVEYIGSSHRHLTI
jgi:hypothetical protein